MSDVLALPDRRQQTDSSRSCCLLKRSCLPVPRLLLPARIRALLRQPSVPVEASLSLIHRGLCSLVHVSSLLSSDSTCFVFLLALAPASSTSAPSPRALSATLCDQPSSSPRSTSSRSPCNTGSFCSSSLRTVQLGISLRVRFTRRHQHRDRLHRAVPLT